MAGKIKQIIDIIIKQRANGNPTIETTTKIKLSLKGVNPEKYNDTSPDDPLVIQKLQKIASEFGVAVH